LGIFPAIQMVFMFSCYAPSRFYGETIVVSRTNIDSKSPTTSSTMMAVWIRPRRLG
jgi:hypothetical protein